ncbi:MAG: DNA repair protein RadA [Egibacteraceae bacterium]
MRAMPRTRTVARCGGCGHVQARWEGRCPECGQWGTMVEEAPMLATTVVGNGAGGSAGADAALRPAQPISEVPLDGASRAATGIGELDRVLGGGLVAGSVVLLGGEPGTGKSTLLLQAAHALARGSGGGPPPVRGSGGGPPPVRGSGGGPPSNRDGRVVLYVSAEESCGQVRLRAERLGALHPNVLLASEIDLGIVLSLVEHHDPAVLVLDSIQTVRHPEVNGAAGSLTQVRECAASVTAAAKARRMATILVGHVTKDGQLAGPRTLEHLVDVVCELEGDRHHAIRLMRATKNRFGAVGEVGCFEMAASGLEGIDDAGKLFVGEAPDGTTGVAVTLALEGRRPLACEVQALVAPTSLANPRRVASGLDSARLGLLVAVCERRGGVGLADRDVFASTVGGIRLVEPATDLALCLAVASSRRDQPLPRDLVVLGEVGLAGELRLVAQTERRLSEAARLGFRRALLPAAYDGPGFGLALRRAGDLVQAMGVALAAG